MSNQAIENAECDPPIITIYTSFPLVFIISKSCLNFFSLNTSSEENAGIFLLRSNLLWKLLGTFYFPPEAKTTLTLLKFTITVFGISLTTLSSLITSKDYFSTIVLYVPSSFIYTAFALWLA